MGGSLFLWILKSLEVDDFPIERMSASYDGKAMKPVKIWRFCPTGLAGRAAIDNDKKEWPEVSVGIHWDRKSPKRPNPLSRFTQRRPQEFQDMRSVHNFRAFTRSLRVLYFYTISRKRNAYNRAVLYRCIIANMFIRLLGEIFMVYNWKEYMYSLDICILLRKNL